MNEVNARRARLQLGWVTVFGRVYHLDAVSTFHNDDLWRSALTDALLRLFGTHYRKLSLMVTLLLCLSLG